MWTTTTNIENVNCWRKGMIRTIWLVFRLKDGGTMLPLRKVKDSFCFVIFITVCLIIIWVRSISGSFSKFYRELQQMENYPTGEESCKELKIGDIITPDLTAPTGVQNKFTPINIKTFILSWKTQLLMKKLSTSFIFIQFPFIYLYMWKLSCSFYEGLAG